MYIHIINFFAYFIESFIFYYFMKHLFIQKNTSGFHNVSVIVAGYLCCFLMSLIPLNLMNLISFLIINTLLIILLNETGIPTAVFHSFILTSIMSVCELVVINALHISDDFKTNSDISKVIMLCVISKLLYFFVITLLSNIFAKKEDMGVSAKPAIWLNVVPLTSVITIVCFTSIIYKTTLPDSLEYFIAVSSFLLLVMNIFIFWYYDESLKKEIMYSKLKFEYDQEKNYITYQKRLNEQYENNRLLIHDIKKHLSAINDLTSIGDISRIKSYIDILIDSSDLKENIRVSDHDFLNALILRYTTECQNQNISFFTNIRAKTIDFMSENDITSIFCNLIENAMEAAIHTDNSFIELTVRNNENNQNMLIISMKNTCYNNPFSIANTLVSKKSNGNDHGLGLRIIKNTLNKYHGDMNCRYDEDAHFFHITIYMYKTPVSDSLF